MAKSKQHKLKLSDFDDDALEIMYQWANNAIMCGTAQCAQMITAILTEYEQRELRK